MRVDVTLFLLLGLLLFVTPRPAASQRLDVPQAGFSVQLPEGCAGTIQADEAALPAAATYRIGCGADGAMAGVVVTVVRRANLNPLQRQQWMRGRAPLALGALRPVAALPAEAIPFEGGVGLRAEGGERAALVYFTAHGTAHYAVVAEAPAGRFAALQPALIEIARSVRFTDVGE